MTDDGSALQFVSEDVNVHVLEMVDVIARRIVFDCAIYTAPQPQYPKISPQDWERVRQRVGDILTELNPDKCLFDQAYGFLHGRQLRGEA
jgi:hypothetical protein